MNDEELEEWKNNSYEVQKALGYDEILASIAEEAAELGQAALKARRAYNQKNWTPKTMKECLDNVFEEIADVKNTLQAAGFLGDDEQELVSSIMVDKMERWRDRLEQTHEPDESVSLVGHFLHFIKIRN